MPHVLHHPDVHQINHGMSTPNFAHKNMLITSNMRRKTSHTMHYHDTDQHSVFDIFPVQYQIKIKASLLMLLGVVSLTLFIMIGQTL